MIFLIRGAKIFLCDALTIDFEILWTMDTKMNFLSS